MAPRHKLAFFGAAAVPIACHLYQKPGHTLEAAAQPVAGSAITTKAASHDIYVVDGGEAPPGRDMDRLKLSTVSPARAFGVILRLHLFPGQTYVVDCIVNDTAGNSLGTAISKAVQCDTAGEGMAYFPFSPDPKKHQPGIWKAKLNVANLGPLEYEFTAGKPTAEETKSYADHEKAKQQALHAFSTFWVAFPHPELKETFVTATKAKKDGGVLESYNLFQVGGLAYTCIQDFLSDGDRLNGISYRGSVGFGFTMHRTYTPEGHWTEWKDLTRPKGPIQQGWDTYTGNNFAQPSEDQQASCMRYTVECRDGNWIVTNKEKARFINGVRRDDDATLAEAAAKLAEEEKVLQKERDKEEKRKRRIAAAEALEKRKADWLEENKKRSPMDTPDTLFKIRGANPFVEEHLREIDFEELLDPPREANDPRNDSMSIEELGELRWRRANGFSRELFSGKIFQPHVDVIATIVKEGGTERSNQKKLAEDLEASPEASKPQQESTLRALGE